MKVADKIWLDDFVKSITKYSSQGDYRLVLAIAKKGYLRYPDDFVCQYQYAKMLGDYADELSILKKKKLKKESAKLLKPLLRRLRGRPSLLRFGICLNYYYQTENFRGMYRFGCGFYKQDPQRSYYAQGLAAALLSYDLYQKNKVAASKAWAQKGAKAWSHYNLSKEKYYFAHYSAAKALALAGETTKAMKALKQAAVLGKRPITDWEFADVLKLLSKKD